MRGFGFKRLLGAAAFFGVLASMLYSALYAGGPGDAAPARRPEPPVAKLAAAPARPAAAAPASADPYAPPNGSVAELMSFISAVQQLEPTGDSEAAQLRHEKRLYAAIAEAGRRIARHRQAADPQAAAGVRVAFQALFELQSLGDRSASAAITQLLAEWQRDRRPAVIHHVQYYSLMHRLAGLPAATAAERDSFGAEFKAYLVAGSLTEERLQLAMLAGENLEQASDPALAAELLEATIARLPRDAGYAEVSARLAGQVRRLRLPGNSLELAGQLLDRTRIDWAAYRGKVVLVDFWATWCGPCLEELPNVVENYRRYHAQGFDVIGVSLDDSRQQVEAFVRAKKIAWPTIFHDDPNERGWQNPMAVHYGLAGIPTAILVDQQGKVVSLDARGRDLGNLLKKLLGDSPPARKAERDSNTERK